MNLYLCYKIFLLNIVARLSLFNYPII